MSRHTTLICLFALFAAVPCPAQTPAPAPSRPAVSVELLSEPPLAPDEVDRLEARLIATPDDLALRRRLLTHYQRLAAYPANHDARAARLRHVLYVIGHHPEDLLAGSRLAFVSRANDASGHDQALNDWLQAANRQSDSAAVQRHAARFLAVEDKHQAQTFLLNRAGSGPLAREAATLLGFLYAEGVLGVDTPDGQRLAALDEASRRAWAEESRRALDSSSQPDVLLGAAILLPNVSVRLARDPQKVQELADYAQTLRQRGHALLPDERRREFPFAMQLYPQVDSTWRGDAPLGPASSLAGSGPGVPSTIRIAGTVQAAKLLSKTDPVYPQRAREARIQATVRLTAHLAKDGTVQSLRVVSGHPLLQQAALEAVRTWRYQPTLLNGAPVEVITEVDVAFVLPAP